MLRNYQNLPILQEYRKQFANGLAVLIRLSSNIASLNALRRLGDATGTLQSSYTRLSSGLRINKASDDAAGLSISSGLSVDSRVMTVGIRNLSDGLSLLNIAEGAFSELKSVTTRILELAQQSANGTLSREQRVALQAESDALTDEYGRIMNSAEFNGLKILDGSLSTLDLQVGYGINGSLALSLGNEALLQVGDGQFAVSSTLATSGGMTAVVAQDFNGDGIMDIFTVDALLEKSYVFIGEGDGTFKAGVSYYGAGLLGRSVDINGDGALDILTTGYTSNVFTVTLGNGDGTFKSMTTVPTGSMNLDVQFGDLNGDGIMDIVSVAEEDRVFSVHFGNGDGTFRNRVNYDTTVPGLTSVYATSIADINGDGFADIVASTGLGIGVYLNNGDGSFRLENNLSSSVSFTSGVVVGDFNYDGNIDIASPSSNNTGLGIYLGNGDGTFKAGASYDVQIHGFNIEAVDMNGDGVLDIVSSAIDGNPWPISIAFGNGDGTFKLAVTSPSVAFTQFAVADLNGDGNNEILVASLSNSFLSILSSTNTAPAPYLERVNIMSQNTALEALDTMRGALSRLNAELANIGASVSRITTAIATASIARENFISAASQITDVDVAQEAAELVRKNIIQQAAASVLAQANQLPALALKLLN